MNEHQLSTNGVEPERGLVLAVFPRDADADDELAEMRELARTAGVEPHDEVVQLRERPESDTMEAC